MKHAMKTRRSLGKPKRNQILDSFMHPEKSIVNRYDSKGNHITNKGTHQAEKLSHEFMPNRGMNRRQRRMQKLV